MKESTTYQAILKEGEAKGREEGLILEARSALLRLGRKRFGPEPEHVSSAVAKMDSRDMLEVLLLRALDVESWDDLLGTATS